LYHKKKQKERESEIFIKKIKSARVLFEEKKAKGGKCKTG